MKTFKRLGIGCLVLSLLILGIGFFLPSDWHVEESVMIQAPSVTIHPYVSDLRAWQTWAGYRNSEDTSLVLTYSGPRQGLGASMTWRGELMGSGKMVVTRSHPDSGVWLDVRLEESFDSKTTVIYETTPEGTRVVFRDQGSIGYRPVGGYLVALLEPTLSAHFRESLRLLKSQAERRPPAEESEPVPADSTDG